MNHPSHRTVDRVVGILETVSHARHDGLTLPDIAKRLEAPKSSIQDLVYGLVAAGYLIVGPGHRYQVGPGAYTLSASAGAPPWTVSDEQLGDLAARTGATALVAIRMGDHAIYVKHTKESELFNYYTTHRVRRPLLTSAAGKMMLAMGSDQRLHQFLRASEHDPKQVERLLLELPTIRQRGYSMSWQGSLSGIDAMAAPIGDDDDAFSTVAVMSWPTESLELSSEQLADILKSAVVSWRTD